MDARGAGMPGYACMALGVLTKGLIALVFPGAAAFSICSSRANGGAGGSFGCCLARRYFWRSRSRGTFSPDFAIPGSSGFTSSTSIFCDSLAGAILAITTNFRGRFTGRCIWYGCFRGAFICLPRFGLLWMNIGHADWRTRARLLPTEILRSARGCSAGFSPASFWSSSPISTNQEYYTFPAYLPLLLLIADGVSRAEGDSNARGGWLRSSAGLIAIIGLAASAALFVVLWQSRSLPFEPDIGTVLAKHNIDEDTLSTSHMLDLSYASFAALRLPAILAAITLAITPLASFLLRLRRRHYLATGVLAMGMAVFLIAAHIALGRFGPYLSSKNLAGEIAARARPEDKVMIYGDQAFGSSLLFYLQRPIDLVEGRTTSMWFGSTFPDAPKIYSSSADLQRAVEWPGASLFVCASASERQGGWNLVQQVRNRAGFGEDRLQQPTWRGIAIAHISESRSVMA